MQRIITFCFVFLAFLSQNQAQSPAPAPAQTGRILILGGTAHLGNGQVLENSAIAFENGKITTVSDPGKFNVNRADYTKIFDATGKHIYPGFIALNTSLGLVEVDAVRSTRDFTEVGDLNPNVRAIIAYNTDSDITPTVRSNGVLLAQITPDGGRLAGTSAVVQLDAWNWEDALVHEDGVHLHWPDPMKWTGWETGSPKRVKNEAYAPALQALEQFLAEAKGYCQGSKPKVENLKFEAMRSVFSKEKSLYIHANEAKIMQEAVLFAEKMDCKPVLVGADDAWMITDFLKKHNTAVVLNPTQRLPSRTDEQVYQPYETARMLQEAGILFAISDEGHWRQRNLPFQVGQAVAFGLDYEAAIQSVTLNAATILGIEKTQGSLELQKAATLFISEGDVLDMRTSQVIAAFIDGREIDLSDKHKVLYEKYKKKYDSEKK